MCCGQDELLQTSRLDFVKLRDQEGIKELLNAGYEYARRTDAAGGFSNYFGGLGTVQAPNAAIFS